MDNSNTKLGSDSQDSQDFSEDVRLDKAGPSAKLKTLGIQNAKKKLRAFSIQKKTSMSPVAIPKPLSTGSATVFIGKLASVKPVVKPPEDPEKKLPKPPKPGTSRLTTESYINLRKNTLDEIEDMKRKMELVELGIPLGLICPAPNSVTANKAMPTKAMPPIKTFLDPAKVDEIIREAKKAKAEGKEFKFNYNKFVPDYANPFQRKKDEHYQTQDKKDDKGRIRDKYTKRTDKYDSRRPYGKYSEKDTYRDRYKDRLKERDERYKEREDRFKQRERSKEKEDRSRERSKDKDLKYERKESVEPESEKDDLKLDKKDLTKDDTIEAYKEKEVKETDVNLKDFLVCDSWSLDNDDKSKDATPKPEETEQNTPPKIADPVEKLRHSILKKDASPKPKMEKLKPVIDSFKFEIEEDDMLDMFDESTSLDKFTQKGRPYQSPDMKLFDIESKDTSIDELADDTFLESVINEIKSEVMDDSSQDKGLVEYESPKDEKLSITPELDSSRMSSSRSDYSDSYKSVESGYKSTESGYKSSERVYKLTERGFKSPQRKYKSPERSYKSPEVTYSPESYKSPDIVYKSPERSYKSPQRSNKSERYKSNDVEDRKLPTSTVDSLETWDFVLKVCQPLLFRHDKNRCYKETRNSPKVWYSENPKLCDCIKDRSTVYEELELAKMELVDRVHACDQMSEASFHTARGWYPPAHQCLVESSTVHPSTEWEAEDSQLSPDGREISLDREYHRFMKAVWPEAESKSATPRGTPVRATKPDDVLEPGEPRPKKTKLSSEGWSQDSEYEDEGERKKIKVAKEKRKRKHSTSTLTDSEVETKKRKKSLKKKDAKKAKAKSTKQLSKKVLKKIKEKHKKKKKVIKIEETDEEEHKKDKKKKDKRSKKKKAQKRKKKIIKKKKSRKQTSTSTSESTQTDSEFERKKPEKKKKRKKSTSESTQSDEVFDVNILNNIKSERLSDEENKLEFSKHREIINVKELQNDFVGNSIQVKKEQEEIEKEDETEDVQDDKSERESESPASDVTQNVNLADIKIPDDPPPLTSESQQKPDDSSQDTQDSAPRKVYEKDESHLRPSSQNSNYSFQDVMQSGMYHKEMEMEQEENYEGNYEMYEQMAMEYQSDVATQRTSPQRIETVVRTRVRGEIKCDWRPGDTATTDAAYTPQRPSRWGLKPSEVNIVLTGGSEQYPIPSVVQPVYKIQSIANNRNDNSNTGYDEAYADMYGASDKLQYGDCFNAELPAAASAPASAPATASASVPAARVSSLDDRINRALRTTVLGVVVKEPEEHEADKENVAVPPAPAPAQAEGRSVKRVSFADGYKPGQDSDTEAPPKKKKRRRVGCAWPCPSSHPDHVPLWDALPPPPPPPGSPPPPLHLLRDSRRVMPSLLQLPPNMHKFDPNLPFMPPEPPPGMLNF